MILKGATVSRVSNLSVFCLGATRIRPKDRYLVMRVQCFDCKGDFLTDTNAIAAVRGRYLPRDRIRAIPKMVFYLFYKSEVGQCLYIALSTEIVPTIDKKYTHLSL